MSSKPKDDKYSARDQAEVVAGVMRALDLRRAVMVGHSFGGAVAFATYLELRAEGDQRIVGLAFIDPALYDQPLPFFIAALQSSITRWLMFHFTTPDWRADVVLRQVYANDSVRTRRARATLLEVHGPARRASLVREDRRGRSSRRTSRRSRGSSRRSACPRSRSGARTTRSCRSSTGVGCGRRAGGSVLHVLPKTGHAPQEESPAETAARILEFMSKAGF